MPEPPSIGFALVDWMVLAGYLGLVLLVGVRVGRRAAGRDDFFLGGRTMPMGAVALSVLATSLSAATFIGVPQLSYVGDLTYLAATFGGVLAVLIVAWLFVPAFYRHGVTSIYELLGHTLGAPAPAAASATFVIGRVFAEGARLFIVAIPFALVAYGDTSAPSLIASIAIITAVTAAYTIAGGIRAVIWTDVLQACVVVGSVLIAIGVLLQRIPHGPAEIVETLRSAPGGSKLRVIDPSFDLGKPFTIWSALIGFTIFYLAAFGTDQDLAQRLLTCRSARAGAWSVILANVLAVPVVLLFLIVGLLLYVHAQGADPAVLASLPAGGSGDSGDMSNTREVFVEFMLSEMPTGLRGLMIAGLFAAAMSSLDSALNAMASTTIADFYRPWRRRRAPAPGRRRDPGDSGPESEADVAEELRVSRLAIVGWAAALAGFAIVCVFWQSASGQGLVKFALGVMVFAYAGLLGVFLTALLTPRGNARTAIAALGMGFVTVLLMQKTHLAFTWQMAAASALSFVVCCLGRRAA